MRSPIEMQVLPRGFRLRSGQQVGGELGSEDGERPRLGLRMGSARSVPSYLRRCYSWLVSVRRSEVRLGSSQLAVTRQGSRYGSAVFSIMCHVEGPDGGDRGPEHWATDVLRLLHHAHGGCQMFLEEQRLGGTDSVATRYWLCWLQMLWALGSSELQSRARRVFRRWREQDIVARWQEEQRLDGLDAGHRRVGTADYA